jgi:hypothetical protein
MDSGLALSARPGMTIALATRPASEVLRTNETKGRRSAERRMPTIRRPLLSIPSPLVGEGQGGGSAAACAEAARLPALRRGSRQETSVSWLSSRPGFLGRGFFRALPGVGLSQSSGSTPRIGHSAEGHDARSRSGAACKTARKHRTRSVIRSALAMASLGERDSQFVTETETIVKEKGTHKQRGAAFARSLMGR